MTGKAAKITVSKGFHLSGRDRGHLSNDVYSRKIG